MEEEEEEKEEEGKEKDREATHKHEPSLNRQPSTSAMKKSPSDGIVRTIAHCAHLMSICVYWYLYLYISITKHMIHSQFWGGLYFHAGERRQAKAYPSLQREVHKFSLTQTHFPLPLTFT